MAALANCLLALIATTLQNPTETVRTKTVGGPNRPSPFEEIPSPKAVLIGIKVTADPSGRYIQSIQPVYKRDEARVDGKLYGTQGAGQDAVELIAKKGYAVGGIAARGGSWLDGFRLSFMRVMEHGLDPTDAYNSKWVGGGGSKPNASVESEGAFVIGVYGGTGAYVDCFGLVLAPQENRAAAKPKRSPEPSGPNQRKAERLIRQTYSELYRARRPEDLQVSAAKLLKSGVGTSDEHLRYVLLRDARGMAVKAGAPHLTMRAVFELRKTYEVDDVAMVLQALSALERSARSPAQCAELVNECLRLASDFAAEKDSSSVSKVLRSGEGAARRSKDQALVLLVKDKGQFYKEYEKESEAARKAEVALSVDPNNSDMFLVLGKFACFYRNDWESGVAWLAKGSDPLLRGAAEQDLKAQNDQAMLLKAGRTWLNLSGPDSSLPRSIRGSARERAMELFKKAWPRLTGFDKDQARQVILEAQMVIDPRRSRPLRKAPTGWTLDKGEVGRGELAITVDDKIVKTGQYALHLKGTEKPQSVWVRLPAAPGKTYILRMWALTNQNGPGSPAHMILWTGGSGGVHHMEVALDKPWWTLVERTLYCEEDRTHVTIGCATNFGKGEIWLDDISVTVEGEGVELLTNGSFEQ